MPLGVYLSLFKKNRRATINLLYICIVSLSVEMFQGLLGIGTADIDDSILNGLGGWVGILGYKLLLLIVRNEKHVRTTITVLSAVVGLPVIYYFLFVIKMRF
ncbi:VanZ family protein [Paenibacillus hexagrammi]|uniref:VanZ family protein n=1 Tax=Paenibacillus hexagrammi TaxID=2908839 RepID=A0ABY3SSV6_9BACL|nr:VanZ family protein [Paenibacillus sp. YPD9-1]UJF36508.1 VanZ family protein [Paenibacillus sp. YPD9-1]